MAPVSMVANERSVSPPQGSVEPGVEVDLLANPYTIIVKSLEKKKAKLLIRHSKLLSLRDDFIKEPAKLDASQREAILRIDDVVLQVEFIDKLQDELTQSLKGYERSVKQAKVGSKKKESDMQLDLIIRFFTYKKVLSSLATEDLGSCLVADTVISLKELEAFRALHDIFASADKCDNTLFQAVHCVLTGNGDEVVPGMTGYYAKKILTKVILSESYEKHNSKTVECPDETDERNNADSGADLNADSPISVSHTVRDSELLLEKECTLSSITLNSSTRSNCGSGRSFSSPERTASTSVVDGSSGLTTTEGVEPPAEKLEKAKRKRRPRRFKKGPKTTTVEDGKSPENGEKATACNTQSNPSPQNEASHIIKGGGVEKAIINGNGNSEHSTRVRDAEAKRIPRRNDDHKSDQPNSAAKGAVQEKGPTNKRTNPKHSDATSKRGERRPMGQSDRHSASGDRPHPVVKNGSE